MGVQAVLLTSAALTAEVSALKQNLERSESELGRAKKQLEDKEVSNTVLNLYLTEKDFGCKRNNKDNVGTPGATNKVATLKEAVSVAEHNEATE